MQKKNIIFIIHNEKISYIITWYLLNYWHVKALAKSVLEILKEFENFLKNPFVEIKIFGRSKRLCCKL
jgi:hypothetical protein